MKMEENRREMEELQMTWAEKLAESQKTNLVSYENNACHVDCHVTVM